MLDPYWLFANFAASARQPYPLCLIAGGDDHWSRELLAPLLGAAGYRITFDPTADKVDVVIAPANGVVPESLGAPVVRLRDAASAAAANDASIWRYDREALLQALGRATQARG